MSNEAAVAEAIAMAERVYLWCGSAYRLMYYGAPFFADQIPDDITAFDASRFDFKHGHVVGIGGANGDEEAYVRTRRLLFRLCPKADGWRAHIVTVKRQTELEEFAELPDTDWSRPGARIQLSGDWEA